MKYLKLYERYKEYSIQDWLEEWDESVFDEIDANFEGLNLTSLRGIEKFTKLEIVYCHNNYIKSLNGIENLTNLKHIYFDDNRLTSLEELKNLINLSTLNCAENKLTSLKGIENLTNITTLYCEYNKINSLKELQNLINIDTLYCQNNKLNSFDGIENLTKLVDINFDDNPIKYPTKLPEQFLYSVNEVDTDVYHPNLVYKFQSYEYQKMFLTKFPEKIEAIKQFGIHEKIKEEFADIIEGSEFGFFNLR